MNVAIELQNGCQIHTPCTNVIFKILISLHPPSILFLACMRSLLSLTPHFSTCPVATIALFLPLAIQISLFLLFLVHVPCLFPLHALLSLTPLPSSHPPLLPPPTGGDCSAFPHGPHLLCPTTSQLVPCLVYYLNCFLLLAPWSCGTHLQHPGEQLCM